MYFSHDSWNNIMQNDMHLLVLGRLGSAWLESAVSVSAQLT